MQGAVTYSLNPRNNGSQEYYNIVRQLTDEVVKVSPRYLSQAVSEFRQHLTHNNIEQLRSNEEYMLELLSFGLLWKSYGGYAMSASFAPFSTLSKMAEWRKKHRKFKPSIDIARGVMVTLFLMPPGADCKTDKLPTLAQTDKFFRWLTATGEFREQALRFVKWRGYWDTMEPLRWEKGRDSLFALVDWFIVRSQAVLGDFTRNVDTFLEQSGSRYMFREDRVQCMRSKSEYHLNMVGAEIMNRAFRDDFLKTPQKALLLPGCMRGTYDVGCKGVRVAEGLKCAGCSVGCNVGKLKELGKIYNFDTYIIPHASDLSLWSPKPGVPERGVIAVACVTTLIEGGWELKRYGVSAQCVLLDFSGCKKHWHKKGLPTFINYQELKRILAD